MNNDDWETLFLLLEQVVNLPLATWQQKKAAVIEEAAAIDASDSLEEFIGWFSSQSPATRKDRK